jgi:predicted kinase
MLYIFSGLPGVGKTTLARHLARERQAVYLRIDTIEDALRDATGTPAVTEGYLIAYRVAADNLALGLSVVADSVNPVQITRAAWRSVAIDAGVAHVEIEVICSDAQEHRKRVESRMTGSAADQHLTWDAVQARSYERWDSEPLVIDTAGHSVSESINALHAMLGVR